MAAQSVPVAPNQTHQQWRHAALRNTTKWRSSLLQKAYTLAGVPTAHYGLFQALTPTISCPPHTSLKLVGGVGDGAKWLCMPEKLTAPCLILSIGSNNDTKFERAAKQDTPCEIVTIDCTIGPHLSLVDPNRHRFFPVCIGSAEAAEKDPGKFVTFAQLMARIGWRRDLAPFGGHLVTSAQSSPPHFILKMDVEGFEWDVLGSIGLGIDSEELVLPSQIAMELHVLPCAFPMPVPFSSSSLQPFNESPGVQHVTTLAHVHLFIQHILSLGYGLASRDDNPIGGTATELFFHKLWHSRRFSEFEDQI